MLNGYISLINVNKGLKVFISGFAAFFVVNVNRI